MNSIIKKLSTPEDKELFKRVDEVMHYLWDPIGISDYPEARDEYYSYTPHVFSMLINGSNSTELAKYLHESATKTMGLFIKESQSMEIAELLVIWREVVNEERNTLQ